MTYQSSDPVYNMLFQTAPQSMFDNEEIIQQIDADMFCVQQSMERLIKNLKKQPAYAQSFDAAICGIMRKSLTASEIIRGEK